MQLNEIFGFGKADRSAALLKDIGSLFRRWEAYMASLQGQGRRKMFAATQMEYKLAQAEAAELQARYERGEDVLAELDRLKMDIYQSCG